MPAFTPHAQSISARLQHARQRKVNARRRAAARRNAMHRIPCERILYVVNNAASVLQKTASKTTESETQLSSWTAAVPPGRVSM